MCCDIFRCRVRPFIDGAVSSGSTFTYFPPKSCCWVWFQKGLLERPTLRHDVVHPYRSTRVSLQIGCGVLYAYLDGLFVQSSNIGSWRSLFYISFFPRVESTYQEQLVKQKERRPRTALFITRKQKLRSHAKPGGRGGRTHVLLAVVT